MKAKNLEDENGYVALSILFALILGVIIFVNNRISQELNQMVSVSAPVVTNYTPNIRTVAHNEQQQVVNEDTGVVFDDQSQAAIDESRDLAKKERKVARPVYEGPMDEVILPQ